MMEGYHISVFFNEVLEGIGSVGDGYLLDCTLGDGGHSLPVLKRGGKIIGIDVDPEALERTRKRFLDEGINQSRFVLIQGNFRDLENLILEQTDPPALAAHKALPAGTARFKIKAVLFDLGVSTLQLWNPERGFSFMREGPLDMRMDPTLGVTALDLIKTLTKGELENVFSKMGEEKYSRRLSDAIFRSSGVIKTTTDLSRLVESVVGRQGKINPATKIFQSLRIVVNDELGAIAEGLKQAINVLDDKGRILVISFHSLEDRIVKNVFRDWDNSGRGKVLTKKPIIPTEEEISMNAKSRSAKLRIFQKNNL